MFGRKSRDTIDSLIGGSTSIEGNLRFRGGLRLDGHVKGNIVAESGESSMLVISEQARVEGEVRATHVSSTARSSARYIRASCLNCSRTPA